MTGRTGRGVKRTVPKGKKARDSTIPTQNKTERDAVLDKLKGKK